MSKVKLNSIIAIGLLLILVIGVLGYGCTSSKSLQRSNGTTVKNSDQTTNLPTDNSDAIHNQDNSYSMESNTKATAVDNENSLPSGNDHTNQLKTTDGTHDRVRPEVRRILHSKFSSEAELQTALDGASILQDYLDRSNQDAVAMIKRYDCSVLSLTQADQNLIQSLTFDTEARKNKIKNGLKDYQPAVSIEIQIDNQGNAVSPCSNIN